VSQVARTASLHAVSSTPFGAPSSVGNPGPGTYAAPSCVAVKRGGARGGFGAGLGLGGAKGDRGSAGLGLRGRLVVAPAWNPPSVPTTLSKGPFAYPRG
jgi:hypothetical protein